MSISKAFRVLSLVLFAVLVPATAFAGTTAGAPARPAKAAHTIKASKVKPAAGKAHKKLLKVKKSSHGARPKVTRQH